MQIDKGKLYRENVDQCYDCWDWGGCIHKTKLQLIEGKLKVVIQDCDDYKAKGVDL